MIRIIGDIEGRNDWEYAIEGDPADQYVFLGNYVDGLKKDAHIISNLERIIQFKENYGDRCILLLGNKDIQYRDLGAYKAETFRKSYSVNLNNLFTQYRRLFQIAHQVDNFLFTNAGVSQAWANFAAVEITDAIDKWKPDDLAELLNMLDESRHQIKVHWKSPAGPTQPGRENIETIPIPGYHQFVGQYYTEHLWTKDIFKGVGYKDRSVTFCNCLHARTDFFNIMLKPKNIEVVSN